MGDFDCIVDVGLVGPKDLERLHGRLAWFNSSFGRKLNRGVKIISKFSRSLSVTVRVVDGLKVALRHIMEYVQKSKPPSISRCVGQTWFIFSDGAYMNRSVQMLLR